MMLSAVLGLFACIPLDQPTVAPYEAAAVGSFWAGHMSQLCWQGYHRTTALALGVPLVAVLLVLLPVSMFGFLLYHRQDLSQDRLRHFLFMFRMYKPEKFYWEVLILLQTAVLVAISVFGFSLGTYYACLALTAALAATMMVHA
jgi:hypothetical protein